MSHFVFGARSSALAIDEAFLREARLAVTPPREKLLELLDQLLPLWRRGGEARQQWLATDPTRELGWKPPMIELGLDQFARRLDSRAALARLRNQLGPEQPEVRHAPLGVVLQVIAANIFFGPAEALLAGLITGNVTLVKQPAGDGGFLAAFIRSIELLDPKLLTAVALLDWRGGDEKIESLLASSVDAILIAAGPDAVRRYRQKASPTCELIELGPRTSVAVVSTAGLLSASRPAHFVAPFAHDVVNFEQSACGSPQAIYVQHRTQAIEFAEELSQALDLLEGQLPEANLDLDTRSAIGAFRGNARYAGSQRLFPTKGAASVVFDEAPTFRSPPLHRNILVKPYSDLNSLGAQLDQLRGSLQTIGLCISDEERADYIDRLTRSGARRFCLPGEMSLPPPEIAGDGMHELARLTRHVAI